jgi:hypothetical protein
MHVRHVSHTSRLPLRFRTFLESLVACPVNQQSHANWTTSHHLQRPNPTDYVKTHLACPHIPKRFLQITNNDALCSAINTCKIPREEA